MLIMNEYYTKEFRLSKVIILSTGFIGWLEAFIVSGVKIKAAVKFKLEFRPTPCMHFCHLQFEKRNSTENLPETCIKLTFFNKLRNLY